jgi:sugar phosphate permease
MTPTRKLRIAAVVAAVFGLATVISGGRALFGDAAAQAAVGQAVGFVLWFNFLVGFAYVAVAAGLCQARHWAVTGAALIAGATALVALAFTVHVASGGAYEMRTVGALALRLLFWLALAQMARRALAAR